MSDNGIGELKPYQSQYVPVTVALPGHEEKQPKKEEARAIKVVVRFRPPNKMEIEQDGGADNYDSVADYNDDERSVVIHTSYGEEYGFTFDRVFKEDTSQTTVYDYAAKSIVQDVLSGYNGTVFAYGQTASGKTYTMEGPDIDNEDTRGIIPRMIETIFDYILDANENLEFNIKVSYVEIYMEKIRDLLDSDVHRAQLRVREDRTRGLWIEGATEVYVGAVDEVMAIMREGAANRAVAHTKMNVDSSRSHAVFILTVTVRNLEDLSTRSGKLYLVDLAGSEKVGKTNVSGVTLEEAKMINKSLSALGNVITALTDGTERHIPYRDSKLTRVLQEALGGNSLCTLISNVTPSSYNELETLSTLRFATRAKKIKNQAKINKERSAKELTILLEKAEKEIIGLMKYVSALENALKNMGVANLPAVTTVNAVTDDQLVEQHSELLLQLQEKETEIDEQNEAITLLKEELLSVKGRSTAMERENSELLQRLADATFELERMEFERNEENLNAEVLESSNAALKADLENSEASLAKAKAENSLSAELTRQLEEELNKYRPSSEVTSADMQWGLREAELKRNLDALQSIGTEQVSDGTREVAVQADGDDMTLRARIAELEGTLAALRDRSHTLAEDNVVLDRRARGLEEEKREVEMECESMRQMVTKFEALSNETASNDGPDRYEQLQRAVHKLKLQSEKIGLQDIELSSVRSDLKSAQNEVMSLAEEKTRIRGELVELETSYAGRLKYIEEREKEWEKMRSDASSRARLDREKQQVIEATQTQLREFEQFREVLMSDLQNRCEKVVELEMLLDQKQETHQEQLAAAAGKQLQRKVQYLERNLEQLTTIHQQLMNQNSALHMEKDTLERKISNRNERIRALEALVKQAQTQALRHSKGHEEEVGRYRKLVTDLETAYNTSQVTRTTLDEPTAVPSRLGHVRTRSGAYNVVKQIRGGQSSNVQQRIRGRARMKGEKEPSPLLSPPVPRRDRQLSDPGDSVPSRRAVPVWGSVRRRGETSVPSKPPSGSGSDIASDGGVKGGSYPSRSKDKLGDGHRSGIFDAFRSRSSYDGGARVDSKNKPRITMPGRSVTFRKDSR